MKAKRYTISLDSVGFDDIPYDDLDAQRERFNKFVKRFRVKAVGIANFTCCYSVTYEGTKRALLKLIDECYNGYEIEDDEFNEVE